MGLFDGFSSIMGSVNPFSQAAAPSAGVTEVQSDTPASKLDPLGAAAGKAEASDQLYDAYSKAAGSVTTSPKGSNFYPDDGTNDPSGLATRNIANQLGAPPAGSPVDNPSSNPLQSSVNSITSGAAGLNTQQFDTSQQSKD